MSYRFLTFYAPRSVCLKNKNISHRRLKKYRFFQNADEISALLSVKKKRVAPITNDFHSYLPMKFHKSRPLVNFGTSAYVLTDMAQGFARKLFFPKKGVFRAMSVQINPLQYVR